MEDYQLLATKVYQAFTGAFPNSHADVNRSDTIVYPYVTYNIRTDPTASRNQENLVIDVQIFDNKTSYSDAYGVASKLRTGFKGLLQLEDELHIRYDVRAGATNWAAVPTADPNVIRLEGTINAKIDWRENI